LQKVVDLVIAETEPGPAASGGQDI